jgi:hypothetical protein
METATAQEPIRYLVEESGRRVGVVLSLEDYHELCASQPHDPELLVGLSDAELEVLADSMLVPRQQDRLSHLLQLNREGGLSAEEEQELDRLLEQIDQMNVLKARALYTLHQGRETPTG